MKFKIVEKNNLILSKNDKNYCPFFINLLYFDFVVLRKNNEGEAYFPQWTGWVIGWSEDEGTGISKTENLKTENECLYWKSQTVPQECEGWRGNDISAASNNVAWAAGQNLPFFIPGKAPLSGIFFTKDGGVIWVPPKILVDAHDVQLWKVSFVGTRR